MISRRTTIEAAAVFALALLLPVSASAADAPKEMNPKAPTKKEKVDAVSTASQRRQARKARQAKRRASKKE